MVIAGIDATADALAEMEKGNLNVTVFQDAKGQGRGAVETDFHTLIKLDAPGTSSPRSITCMKDKRPWPSVVAAHAVPEPPGER